MDQIKEFEKKQTKKKLPSLKVGQVVKVSQKIKEKDKYRIQIFEGMIIAMKNGKGVNGTMTVRKEASGVMVEKVFPLHSPLFDFEIVRQEKVRRAKLYYLRQEEKKRKVKEDKDAMEVLMKEKDDMRKTQEQEEKSKQKEEKKEKEEAKSEDKKEEVKEEKEEKKEEPKKDEKKPEPKKEEKK